MIFNDKPAYTFDDVLLRPYKSLPSRNLADPSTYLFAAPYVELNVPIISANMNSITEVEMAVAMYNAGGLGILHRYASIEKVVGWIKELVKLKVPAIPSIGVLEEVYEEEAYWAAGARIICVDVANGYSDATFRRVKTLYEKGWRVIAGNVATGEAACFLAEAGADIIKVGIGPGSVCTTRIVTGCGVPQLSAIMEVYDELRNLNYDHVKIIADGGVRSSGDIVKALAAGANAVMVGGLLAGSIESATPQLYAGMASNVARGNGRRNGFAPKMSAAPEGVDVFISNIDRGDSVKNVMKTLADGIKSGMSYCGARTLHELREFAEFQVITSNGVRENGAHFGV